MSVATTNETTDGPSDEVLLRVEGLEAGYESRAGFRRVRVSVVAGIDLVIPAGRTVGVVGESGCGKSTLARAIVGLRRPFAGRVEFDGRDIASASPRDRRRLARDLQMVFQDPFTSLNPRMSVGELVAEGLHIHPDVVARGERDAEVSRLLDLVGLRAEHADRGLHELSGGQCQRVSIARALAVRPRLIVCDEAVSALDVSVRAQILNLLADLQSRLGVSYLFISHDLDVVRHIAHDVQVMYLGTIVESGTTAQVFANPQHPYTRALLSAAPSIRDRPDAPSPEVVLSGDVPSPADPPTGCRFRTRCWMATEVCASETPPLILRPGVDHPVACHYADDRDSTAPAATA